MAQPLGPVPKLLIPFFRSGVMRELVSIGEAFGNGLNLYNALTKAWPRDPSLDYGTYQGLIGWLSRFTAQSMSTASYINTLYDNSEIDWLDVPKNYFLKRPSGSSCNLYVNVGYNTFDSDSGTMYENTGSFFIDQVSTVGEIKDQIEARINDDLQAIAATNNRNKMYEISRPSITLKSIVRTC